MCIAIVDAVVVGDGEVNLGLDDLHVKTHGLK
jgi:hypothetical protein